MSENPPTLDGRVSTLEYRVASIEKAFPGGDIDGHRRYHELMIERTSEVRRLRVAIQEKTISGLLWALIIGIGLAVWSYVKTALFSGRGP